MESGTRKILAILGFLLVVGATIYFLRSNPKTFLEQRAVVSPPHASASAPLPKMTEAEMAKGQSRKDFWNSLSQQLSSVGTEDQLSLNNLRREANRIAAEDREAFDKAFADTVISAENPDLRYAFFMIDMGLRESTIPASLASAVLAKDHKGSDIEDPHHGGGISTSISAMKIHALTKVQEIPDFVATRDLVDRLWGVVKSNSDLAIVRESMKLLLHLKAASRAELANAVADRPEADRFVYEDLIQ